MKRSRLVAVQIVCLLVVVYTILVGYSTTYASSLSQWRQLIFRLPVQAADDEQALNPTPEDQVNPASHKSQTLKLYEIAPYVASVLDPEDRVIPRLTCPRFHPIRYEYLRASHNPDDTTKLRYFFAVDLRQSFEVLPRLLSSIIEAVRYLGPSVCALSIVEGYSTDGTYELLDALRPELKKIGLQYFLQSSDIDSRSGDHVAQMAQLRNLALKPLVSDSSLGSDGSTTVVFLSNAAICTEDILELVHQRIFQTADMTCAMDWTYLGADPTFRDIWVARTMKGESFFRIPESGSWDWAWNLFWNDPKTRGRFHNKVPFQVFSCWNGAVAFGAAPVLGLPVNGDEAVRESNTTVSFRAPVEGECPSGESALFCKDLWLAGYGRIAVVPSINIEYTDSAAELIKDEKGYTSKWIEKWGDKATRIDWVEQAPEQVRCMPGWENQSWRPWNETFS